MLRKFRRQKKRVCRRKKESWFLQEQYYSKWYKENKERLPVEVESTTFVCSEI